MRTSFRFWGPPLLAAGIFLFALTGTFRAQDDAAGDGRKAQDKQVHAVLRTIINSGADIYNRNRDYAGCCRYWQGALAAVRPLLDHHPDLQKAIDAGVRNAEGVPVAWQRAFALREVLDRVRDRLGRATPNGDDKAKKDDDKAKKDDDKAKKDDDKAKKDDDKAKKDDDKAKKDDDKAKKDDDKAKKDDDKAKKDDDKAKKDDDKAKKDDDKAKKDNGKGEEKERTDARVSGQVTYKGKPLSSGYVTFIGEDNRRYSASIRANGSYQFRKVSLPAGEYTVLVEESPGAAKGAAMVIPERYRNSHSSPLRSTLAKGQNALDLNLQ